MGKPTWSELLNGIDKAEVLLSPVVGRWSNGISGRNRFAVSRGRNVLMRLLVRAGRRPVKRRVP